MMIKMIIKTVRPVSPPPITKSKSKLSLLFFFSLCFLLVSLAGCPDVVDVVGSGGGTYGDFNYTIQGTTIEISRYNGNGGAVTIPDNIDGKPVTSIGQQAFERCASVTSVTIPNSVTSIGVGAFNYCTGLTGITIPASVTSIGWSAFFHCTSLASITIPASVTSIEDSAFSNCTGLNSITIPNGVTSIGSSAFNYCTGLTSITVESGNNNFAYGTGFFYNKVNGQIIHVLPSGKSGNVIIPDGVTSIKDSAFAFCTSLTNITIPNSVTSIGQQAFDSCISLTSVTFQGTIASGNFDIYAFYQLGDLRASFYKTNSTNGTPGTYTRTTNSSTWTKQ